MSGESGTTCGGTCSAVPPGRTAVTGRGRSPAHYDRELWHELCSLRFLDDARGAVILGPVGVGKTHLASALGHVAIRRRHTVTFSREALTPDPPAVRSAVAFAQEDDLWMVTLAGAIHELGVPAAAGRGAAIRQLVLQAPAPVVAQALGYQDKTTSRLVTEAGGTWSRYAGGDHNR